MKRWSASLAALSLLATIVSYVAAANARQAVARDELAAECEEAERLDRLLDIAIEGQRERLAVQPPTTWIPGPDATSIVVPTR